VADPGQSPYPIQIVAASSANGVFTSFDGGATWADSGSGLSTADVLSVTVGVESIVDPADPTRQADSFFLYAATATGVERGRSLIAIVEDRASPGVFQAELEGVIWLVRGDGIHAEPVQAVAVSPAGPGGALAGAATSGVFLSSSGGCRWRALDPGSTLSNGVVHDLLILPDVAGPGATVLAATGGGGVNRVRILAP
jgi:hypothetical protein